MRAVDDLLRQVSECDKCSLAKTRTNAVFGVGDINASLMFVGEAPGYYEDRQGEPFVGAAGQLLDTLLRSIGLGREQVYIANVLKCRPPANRDPKPEEIDACTPYLFSQLELIRPKVVCTLGNFSTRLLLGKGVSISKVRGRKFAGKGYFVVPIYHPAAALYTRSMLADLEGDFLRLKEMLDEAIVPPDEAPEQASLF